MAWLDFIKRIRQDEEGEQKRDKAGGFGNSMFGFLDDVLDTGDRVFKKDPDTRASDPFVTPPPKPPVEEEVDDSPEKEFMGFEMKDGKNKTIFGWNAAALLPKDYEKTYKVETGQKFKTSEKDYLRQFDNQADDVKRKYVNDLMKKAEEGDEAAKSTVDTLKNNGRFEGGLDEFLEGANERFYGGLTRGTLRTADFLTPGKNTFGMEELANDMDPTKQGTREFTDTGKFGENVGTGMKTALDVASLVVPAGKVDKLADASQFVKTLQAGNKAQKAAGFVARKAPGSLVASGVDMVQQVGRGNEVDPARSAGVGLGIDLLAPGVFKGAGKLLSRADDATGNVVSRKAGEFVDVLRRGGNAADTVVDDAVAVADEPITVYRGGDPSEPVNFVSENREFAQRFADDAVGEGRPGQVLEYTINKGEILDPRIPEHRAQLAKILTPKEMDDMLKKTPSGTFLADDEVMARDLANRLGYKGVAVDEMDLGRMPKDAAPLQGGSVTYAINDPSIAKQTQVLPTNQRPNGDLQLQIEEARNAGDNARVNELIEQLPEADRPAMRSAMGMADETKLVVDPVTKQISRQPLSVAAPTPTQTLTVDPVDPARQFQDVVAAPAAGTQRQRSFLETSQRSPYNTPEQNAAIQAVDPQTYTVKAQDPVLEAATSRVDNDFDGAMRYVDNDTKWTDDKAATLMALASKARTEGRIDDFVELLKKIDEGGREAGRGNAILAAWKRLSPEGIIKMAQREVDDIGSRGRLKPQVERLKETVEKAGKLKNRDVTKLVDDAASEKSVGEKVAKNIETYMTPQKKKKVDTLVSELTRKIKDEMIAPKPGAPKRTATDVLSEVFKREGEAAEAFPEAQSILRERFKGNKEVLAQLDDFFGSTLGAPSASKTLDSAIREVMKKNDVKIASTITKSWNEQITDISTVAQRLVDDVGLTPEQARIIAEEVGSRVKGQVDAAKLSALQRLAKEAPKKTRPILEEKIAKLSNLGALNDSDYYDLARMKLDLPTLDNKTIEEISGLSQRMQDLPDGPEKNQVLGDILQKIADTMPITGREKFNAYRYQNLLSSPRTQLRNIAANTFNTLVTRPATLFTGAVGDVASSAVTRKPRERYFAEIPQYYKGLVKGFFDAQDAMTAAWKGTADITNPDFVDQFGKGAVQAARMRNLPKKWTVVSRLMEAQDRMFSGMIAGGEYSAQITRGVDEATAQKAAHEMAEYSLLRQALDPKNATGQGEMLSKIDQASQFIADFANKVPMGRWMVPFIRTPLNFGKQWLEFSPVGLANATVGDYAARRLGKEAMSESRRLEALNKGMLGSALTGLGTMMAADDLITWSAPDNQRDRDLFYAEGKKPFSVKIGDKWVPLINFGPFGLALAMPAAFKQNFQESPDSVNDNVIEKTFKSVAGLGEMLSQQTFLQGVNNLFALVSGDENVNTEKILAGLAGQALPLNALQRYVSTIMDPTFREAENFVEYLQRDIPGLSRNLDPQMNTATGEPNKRNWSDYVAPYSIGSENADKIKQGKTETVAEFYRALGRGNAQRTKTNEQITEALLAGDQGQVDTLVAQHNQQVLSQMQLFINDNIDELQRNPDLLEVMAKELESSLINMNNRSVNSRIRGQANKMEIPSLLNQ